MTRMIRFFAIATVAVGMTASSVRAQQPLPPMPPPATMRALPLPGPKPVGVSTSHVAQAVATQPVPAAPAQPSTNAAAPKIQFASTVYDFGRVKAGDPVKYSFVFTNVGCQALEITGVQPQCGCTAAGEWTKRVEPGGTGEIPLQFNTTSIHGQVNKTTTVSCNDPMQPHMILLLKGNIWKPIDFTPPYTVMSILPDMTNTTATVKIVNNMDQPIDLWSPECAARGFSVELKTNQPGKEFQLTLTATPPLAPGTIAGKVVVKTSTTNAPTLDIPFWANVQAPVVVMPVQVTLPPAPLTAKATPAVTIQNNSSSPLTVSDPQVSLPGVEVQVKELQPGRIFSAQLTFPEGFELKPGTPATLTVKTSHPQFAEVKVPIIQLSRPVTAGGVSPQPEALPPGGKPFLRSLPAGKVSAPLAAPAAQ